MAVHVPAATCQFVSCSVRQGSAPPRDAPPRAMDVPICGESPPPHTHTGSTHCSLESGESPVHGRPDVLSHTITHVRVCESVSQCVCDLSQECVDT